MDKLHTETIRSDTSYKVIKSAFNSCCCCLTWFLQHSVTDVGYEQYQSNDFNLDSVERYFDHSITASLCPLDIFVIVKLGCTPARFTCDLARPPPYTGLQLLSRSGVSNALTLHLGLRPHSPSDEESGYQ